MEMSPFHRLTWFGFMIFGSAFTGLEATTVIACGEEISTGEIVDPEKEPVIISEKDFTCLVYPTHVLNCSWAFLSLEEEVRVSVNTSICNGDETLVTLTSEGRVGSSRSPGDVGKNLNVILDENLHVILHISIFLQDQWKVYYYMYDHDMLEVLSPPPNITGSFKDNNLLVTWDRPSCVLNCEPHCLEYELDFGDQETPKTVSDLEKPSYTEPNVDLTQSYTVRIRTRKIGDKCFGSLHWSNWSEPFTVQARLSTYNLNTVMIVAISLGVPMILLALLLVFRHPRLYKCLFPPIPCPPPKYLHVLQNSDAFVFSDLTVKQEEENTMVFYSEEEKTH